MHATTARPPLRMTDLVHRVGRALLDAPGPLTASQVAERAHSTRPTARQPLVKMHRAGWLTADTIKISPQHYAVMFALTVFGREELTYHLSQPVQGRWQR